MLDFSVLHTLPKDVLETTLVVVNVREPAQRAAAVWRSMRQLDPARVGAGGVAGSPGWAGSSPLVAVLAALVHMAAELPVVPPHACLQAVRQLSVCLQSQPASLPACSCLPAGVPCPRLLPASLSLPLHSTWCRCATPRKSSRPAAGRALLGKTARGWSTSRGMALPGTCPQRASPKCWQVGAAWVDVGTFWGGKTAWD